MWVMCALVCGLPGLILGAKRFPKHLWGPHYSQDVQAAISQGGPDVRVDEWPSPNDSNTAATARESSVGVSSLFRSYPL